MSMSMVRCPHCRTRLRSDRPIPSGITLNCPDCQGSFTPDEDYSADLRAGAPRFGAGHLVALGASVILGGSMIVAAILFTRTSATTSLEEKPDPFAAERRKLDEQKKQLDDQRRAVQVAGLIAKGEEALRQDKYAQAEDFFARAIDANPTSAEAVKGLATARAGLAALAKSSLQEKKQQAEVEKLLAEAKKLSDDKQYAQAVRLLESARAIQPASRAVLDALSAAQVALDADNAQKKNLAEFRKLFDAARVALAAERFTDAVRDYQSALRLMPDDLEAQQGLKQAEAKLAAVANKDQRRQALENLLDRARKAQGQHRYNDAIAALNSAAKLDPDDRDIPRLLRFAEDGLKQARSKNGKLVAQAEEAIRLTRYEEAQRLAEEAVKSWPDDTRAEKALRLAERLLANARTGTEAYLRFMQQGALAVAALRYADAVVAYTEALRMVPNDPEAVRLLSIARQGLNRDLKARNEYDRQMKLGASALARQSYAAAIKAYSDALKFVPDDPLANEGLSKARYGKAVLDGDAAVRAKRKTEAIRAYEAALDEKPGDFQATAKLRQARAMR